MSVADDWFEEWWARLLYSPVKRARALDNDIPRPEDAPLWRERAYDAETDALRAVIRTDQGRAWPRRPGDYPQSSQAAIARLLRHEQTKDTDATSWDETDVPLPKWA